MAKCYIFPQKCSVYVAIFPQTVQYLTNALKIPFFCYDKIAETNGFPEISNLFLLPRTHVEGKHTCLLSCFVATHEQDPLPHSSFRRGGGRREEVESFVKRLIMQTTSYSSYAKGGEYNVSELGNDSVRFGHFSGQVFGHTRQTCMRTILLIFVMIFISLLLRLWWQDRAAIECVFFDPPAAFSLLERT